MTTRKKNNLPPEAQPWVREIEKQLDDLARAAGRGDVTDTAQNRTLEIAQRGLKDAAVSQAAAVKAQQSTQFILFDGFSATTTIRALPRIVAPSWATSCSLYIVITITPDIAVSADAILFPETYGDNNNSREGSTAYIPNVTSGGAPPLKSSTGAGGVSDTGKFASLGGRVQLNTSGSVSYTGAIFATFS